MIDVKEASNKALEYLGSFYQNADRVQLEEVELTEDEKNWFITLSYRDPDPDIPTAFLNSKDRKYKIFKIDAENGKVLSMKIRELK